MKEEQMNCQKRSCKSFQSLHVNQAKYHILKQKMTKTFAYPFLQSILHPLSIRTPDPKFDGYIWK